MAAETIQGLNGNFASTGALLNATIGAWEATVETTVVDVSGFSDNGWRAKKPTATVLRGSASGVATTTAPLKKAFFAATCDLSQTKGTITLTATTGCTYAFTGICSNVKMSRPFDGRMDITFDFISSGPITQTWDEA